ncbi:hypothetical protein [Palleronia sp.]|uniref:hypothetical protein n=1 Tax=Palleronia sp. TaxID=1940284 RepID=UPI0035C82954
MDEDLNIPTEPDRIDTAPPYAPLAMPRQVLERDRREGMLSALFRLLIARNA